MRLRKKQLRSCRLYLVLDAQVHNYKRLVQIAGDAIAGGVDIIQLRDKKGEAADILACSQKILKLTRSRVPFILNDRVDLARLSGADGVHLGQNDIPLRQARKLLGSKILIGISCQNYKQARAAQAGGADYVGFGSVFKTLTKPERAPMDLNLLRRVVHNMKIPVFAIGGITLSNMGRLTSLGVERVAVTRSISRAKNIEETVRRFKAMM